MALGGCLSCIKYLVFIFNFLFWLVGCVILALGIWVMVDPNSIEVNVNDVDIVHYMMVSSYVLIVIGSIIMIVGFLGCCGAIRESQCMLATFFVFLFIIFAVLLTIGIYVVVKKDKPEDVKAKIRVAVRKDLELMFDGLNDPAFKAKMDKIQKENKCCGYNEGSKDYGNNVPASCEGHREPDCTTRLTDKTADLMNKYSVIIAGVVIGMGIVMLLGMIFSMMLCCAIRDTA